MKTIIERVAQFFQSREDSPPKEGQEKFERLKEMMDALEIKKRTYGRAEQIWNTKSIKKHIEFISNHHVRLDNKRNYLSHVYLTNNNDLLVAIDQASSLKQIQTFFDAIKSYNHPYEWINKQLKDNMPLWEQITKPFDLEVPKSHEHLKAIHVLSTNDQWLFENEFGDIEQMHAIWLLNKNEFIRRYQDKTETAFERPDVFEWMRKRYLRNAISDKKVYEYNYNNCKTPQDYYTHYIDEFPTVHSVWEDGMAQNHARDGSDKMFPARECNNVKEGNYDCHDIRKIIYIMSLINIDATALYKPERDDEKTWHQMSKSILDNYAETPIYDVDDTPISEWIFQIGTSLVHAPNEYQKPIHDKIMASNLWTKMTTEQWIQQMHPWSQRPQVFATYLQDDRFAELAATAWCIHLQQHLTPNDATSIWTHPFAGLSGFREFWKEHSEWKNNPKQFTEHLQHWLIEQQYISAKIDFASIWSMVQIAKNLDISVDTMRTNLNKSPTLDALDTTDIMALRQ